MSSLHPLGVKGHRPLAPARRCLAGTAHSSVPGPRHGSRALLRGRMSFSWPHGTHPATSGVRLFGDGCRPITIPADARVHHYASASTLAALPRWSAAPNVAASLPSDASSAFSSPVHQRTAVGRYEVEWPLEGVDHSRWTFVKGSRAAGVSPTRTVEDSPQACLQPATSDRRNALSSRTGGRISRRVDWPRSDQGEGDAAA